MIKDGYEEFFEYFKISKEDFISFGLDKLILCDANLAFKEWEKLKEEIYSNKTTYIRGYGRDAKGTLLFFDLYKELLGNDNVKKDATNNFVPTRLIQSWTGLSKASLVSKGINQIQNYQVSHIFGKTKNPFLFSAPFNIMFIPKILDPFTGHEARGEIVNLFTKRVRELALNRFKVIIDDYNEIISNDSFTKKLLEVIHSMDQSEKYSAEAFNLKKFKIDAISEFTTIK